MKKLCIILFSLLFSCATLKNDIKSKEIYIIHITYLNNVKEKRIAEFYTKDVNLRVENSCLMYSINNILFCNVKRVKYKKKIIKLHNHML